MQVPSIHDFEGKTEQVLEVILKGAKRREGMKIVSAYRAKEAVFLKFPCRYFLITVYWLTG